MERPLETSEPRLSAFIDAVFDAYYDWHVATGRLDTSRQMESLLRLAPDLLPQTIEGWFARVHPDDRKQVVASSEKAVHSRLVYEGEYRMLRGDGSYVPVRDRGTTILDPQSSSVHMIGAVRDITEERLADRALREAAQLHRTLFSQAVNPAFHIAEDGRFLDANAVGLSFMATTRPRLLRENVGSLWGPEAPAALHRALEHAGSVATLDVEITVGDTVKAMTVTLLPHQHLGHSSCFALGTDLTEHHELRRALEASEESLRREAKALEDANTALHVILDQRNKEVAELEKTVVTNAETMVVPLLERLHRHLETSPEVIYVDAALRSVRELVYPLSQSLDALASEGEELTVRERQIASLIRAGKKPSEIATALYVTPSTVAFHCRNLRRKLGLGPRTPSLAAYLSRLPAKARD